MDSNSNISIAMAVLNGAKFLSEQLKSLAEQTSQPSELVVTDDGSTDRTLAILAEFSKTVPFPVKVYVNEERLGFADNFLAATRKCQGAFVAFCDCDDVWRKDKLEHCFRELQKPSVMLVTHTIAQVDVNLKFIANVPSINKSFTLPKGKEARCLQWAGGASMVLRREVLEEMANRWPPGHSLAAVQFGRRLLPHDEIAFFIANALGDIRFIAEPLISYRLHGANTTNPNSTFRGKLKMAASVGRKTYADQSRFFVAHSRYLARMAAAAGHPDVSELLHRKAIEFAKSAVAVRVRAKIHGGSNRLRKIQMLLGATRRGLYSMPFGINGVRSIAKDAIAALK